MSSKSQKQLTKPATIPSGSGKQHKNSAAVDSFGCMMICKCEIEVVVLSPENNLSDIKRMKMSFLFDSLRSCVTNGGTVLKSSNSA